MPFPFTLSTTGHLTFQTSLTSSTHPSLPSVATSHRSVLRSTLKSHKRLSPADQATNLPALVSSLASYLKYLTTLDLALSGKPIPTTATGREEVDIALATEPAPSWRPTLSSQAIPGKDPERISSRGLDYEIFFAHHTLALIHALLARQSLLSLYMTTGTVPSAEQRLNLILAATRSLKSCHALHGYLAQRATLGTEGPPAFPASVVDVLPATQVALRDLAHAELNLLTVLKDDPYPGMIAQARNKDDREWMIHAPRIPKVRAQVLRRLCVGAGEKAGSATVALKGLSKVSKDLLEYCEDVRRTARAKACRFAGIDADMAGETGKGIAWLQAGMAELGMEIPKDGKGGGLSKLKAQWSERREDRRIEKGSKDWGADGGRLEEQRILEYLERKLTKENDTVNVQIVPEWKPLLAEMPSGMNMPVEEKWKPLVLEEDELSAMRAPPDKDEVDEESSEDEDAQAGRKAPAGAFPGTGDDYGGRSYY